MTQRYTHKYNSVSKFPLQRWWIVILFVTTVKKATSGFLVAPHQPLQSVSLAFRSTRIRLRQPQARTLLVSSFMSSRKTTTRASVTKGSLLESWVAHKDVSFHHFGADEASEIRLALLTWYRDSRRKLPWRGDAPPWEGSTAKVKPSKKKNDKQKTLQQFFAVKKNDTKPEAEPAAAAADVEEQHEAFGITAYGVWVSEIMLQQTRVEAVIPYWIKWMKAFPTVQDLAAATPETVNAHWAGLGFYRRARMLHQAAIHVTAELDGVLPDNVDGLLKLPGIGRYTASAVASIAFNVTVPVVDGNVCRVLSRLRGIANNVKAVKLKDVWGWELAQQIVEAGDGTCAGEVNQALMELGATYCAPSGTGVEEGDPLVEYYWSTRLGREVAEAHKANNLIRLKGRADEESCPVCATNGVSDALEMMSNAIEESPGTPKESLEMIASKCGHAVFPLAPPKVAKREEVLAVAVISHTMETSGDEAYLLVRRPKKGLLAGQWEFPSACVWTSESTNESKKGKRKDMSKEVPAINSSTRRKALNSLLTEITCASDGSAIHDLNECRRTNTGETPVEHVFSHVRHTMWIEHASRSVEDLGQKEWVSKIDSVDREVRWMPESEMQQVGVTSGVKKILKAVKKWHTEAPPVKKRQRHA